MLNPFARLLRIRPVLALGSGLIAACTGVALQAARYDLASALAAVDETNFNVLLSREAVAQAVEATHQARAGLLPSVSLDATQRRSRSASFGSTVSRSGVNSRFDLGLNARADLLDATTLASYRASRVGIAVAELDVSTTRETVRAAVASAYLQHRRNLARRDLIDANLKRADALLELARRQRDAGVATQIDVTRAQAQLAVAQQARLQQETELRASALQFQRLLALPPTEPIDLAPVQLPAASPPPEVTVAAAAALARRPEVARAGQLVAQSDLEVRAARFNRLPSLTLTGNYGRAAEQAFDGNDASVWSAALALSVPVFDGQRTGALTRLALSRQRANQLREAEVQRSISAEVDLAVQNSRSRRAQIEVARTSLALAEDELRLAQIRFEQGAADNREIIEAQNRLAVASDNLLEATYQYDLSRVDLAHATGDVRALLNASPAPGV